MCLCNAIAFLIQALKNKLTRGAGAYTSTLAFAHLPANFVANNAPRVRRKDTREGCSRCQNPRQLPNGGFALSSMCEAPDHVGRLDEEKGSIQHFVADIHALQ